MAKKRSRSKQTLISQYMAKIGSKGGQTKGPSKARDPEKMRAASRKYWDEKKKEQQEGDPDEKG